MDSGKKKHIIIAPEMLWLKFKIKAMSKKMQINQAVLEAIKEWVAE